ncbi:MAG: hypothetical protein U0Q47_09070 [Mycobacterium sp.]
MDQTAFELMRATGRGQLIQCVWVYEHPVDMDGLRRFHRNFSESLGGRLIELSPLPFGRPRWVQPTSAPGPIRVAERPRPRDELLQWADELSTLPIDPVNGPGWYIVVQPLDDGATAISMLGSHVIGDGVGALLAVFEGVTGNIRDGGYARPGSRGRVQAMTSDLRQAFRDLPETARALRKAAEMARQRQRAAAGAKAAKPTFEGNLDEPVLMPSTNIYIDIAEWDARAEALGGNSYSLLAGFAAKLGEHMGRRRAVDGTVMLSIAINLRESLDDDRALALAFANATVDPTTVTSDLTEARNAVRDARERAKGEADPISELLKLIPWLPPSAVRKLDETMFAYSEDLPVSCSNLGDLPPQLGQVDGTDAEYVFIRAIEQNLTQREVQRSHGQLLVVSGRLSGKLLISVEAYQVGAENSKARMRDLARQTLAEFGLTGLVE